MNQSFLNSGINKWNTNNVTNMAGMFFGCENFNESLSFDTSNVVYMNYMFHGCINFNQKLDFNTCSLMNLSRMFANCFNCVQTYEFSFDMIFLLAKQARLTCFTFANSHAKIVRKS